MRENKAGTYLGYVGTSDRPFSLVSMMLRARSLQYHSPQLQAKLLLKVRHFLSSIHPTATAKAIALANVARKDNAGFSFVNLTCEGVGLPVRSTYRTFCFCIVPTDNPAA
ncbi:MAG: hypothetical protein F6K30_00405 [Cyanothece sp. SIO2G6]|nr:hypothetical protein [Cyanothece sp. SIO2G6]